MFWKKKKEKINSEEYLELKAYLDKLRLQVNSLELDLSLYVKKLRVTKGLLKEQKEEDDGNIKDERFNNSVILPT